jgi:undecaprenyl-phosphate 4-deoxy-4-formamido-L-arabinose transferase
MVDISVVVPVYKSEGGLVELCHQVSDALRGKRYELILVDDQSPDGSWAAIKKLCEADSSVVGIRLRKNAGQDCALMAGLRQVRGTFAVIMDDDLQHSPYDIPRLLEACVTYEWDVCYAHFVSFKHVWWKRIGSWLNGKLAEIVIDKPKHIYLSPFKVLRHEIVEEVVRYTGPFPYVDGLILNVTHRLGHVDTAHNPRYQGESNFGLTKSVKVFMRLMTGFSIWPLRFAARVGMWFALFGFSLVIFYLLQYLVWEHRIEGWMTIVSLQLIIGGTLLLSIGLVGEYLGRLYLTCNGKPQSTVSECLNTSKLPAERNGA